MVADISCAKVREKTMCLFFFFLGGGFGVRVIEKTRKRYPKFNHLFSMDGTGDFQTICLCNDLVHHPIVPTFFFII